MPDGCSEAILRSVIVLAMSVPAPGPPGPETGGPLPLASTVTVGRSLAWLGAATAVQQASAFLLGVIIRAILGPARTGVWNLVEVWRQQLSSFSLGTSAAADRDMPELRSQGRSAEESLVRSVAFTFTMGEAAAVAIGFWAYWAIAHHGFSSALALGLVLVPLMAGATSYVSLYQLFLKNQKQFPLYAGLVVVQGAVDWSALLFVLVGGLKLLFVWMVAGWLLRAVIHDLVVRQRRLFRLRLTLRREALFPMLRFGLSITVWSLISQLMLRLDSLVVGLALGTTSLGLYYLGPQVAAAAAALPLSLSVIAWPNLMESFGRGGKSELEHHIERYVRPVGLVVSPLATAVAFFGMSVLVRGFLPGFIPGLGAMKIFVLTVMFVHVGSLLHQTLVALRRIRLLVMLTSLALAAQAAVLGLGALEGLTRTWAAWSAVTGQAVLSLLMLIASCRLLGVSRQNLMRFWVRVPVGWIALVGLMFAVDGLAPTPHGLLAAAGTAAAELAVFAGVATPIALALDRGVFKESMTLLRGSG
jgi:O-antigen/teichoic acid export membrane protein